MSSFPKNDLTEGEGVYLSSFSVQIYRACLQLAIGIEYQLLLTYTEVIN